jgi:hypothetical protein
MFADCGDVPFINDGNILLQEGGNSSYGALAEVTCNTGYKATLNTIVCQDTGEWNNITCNIIGVLFSKSNCKSQRYFFTVFMLLEKFRGSI